ncbi:MAG TPA: hypothetical protein VFP65_17245 [Anaeromyxobacteraceae bacterium]|nr:hypothetical protein [Anaeromyxobacteraceae bacterium]
MRRTERGSALILAVIVVLVVTVIALGVINFASREVAGAYGGARRQALVACAESARQLISSRFHAVGMMPTAIQALNVDLDGAGRQRAVGGHVDDTSGVQINQVVILPDRAFGPGQMTRDLTNVIGGSSHSNGTPIRVLVHCVDQGDANGVGGRQLEIEFGVRFGL